MTFTSDVYYFGADYEQIKTKLKILLQYYFAFCKRYFLVLLIVMTSITPPLSRSTSFATWRPALFVWASWQLSQPLQKVADSWSSAKFPRILIHDWRSAALLTMDKTGNGSFERHARTSEKQTRRCEKGAAKNTCLYICTRFSIFVTTCLRLLIMSKRPRCSTIVSYTPALRFWRRRSPILSSHAWIRVRVSPSVHWTLEPLDFVVFVSLESVSAILVNRVSPFKNAHDRLARTGKACQFIIRSRRLQKHRKMPCFCSYSLHAFYSHVFLNNTVAILFYVHGT